MRNLIAIIGLILVSNNCYAFPVIEGVNVITSMIGVLLTIIVSIFPKFINNKNNKALILLSLFSGILLYLYINQTIEKNDEVLTSIQSRPSNIKNTDKFNIENIEDFNRYNKNIEITQNDLYKIDNLNILNIDNDNSLEQYPTNINKNYKSNENLIISSKNMIKAANYSYENYKRNKVINRVVKIDFWKSNVGNKKIEIKNPFDNNVTFVDIRSNQDIIETHTLENAIKWSISDFYHMSDKQIINWFNNHKNIVFISFKDIDGNYETLEYRLKDIKGLNYHYVKGGLNYYFNKGYTITPKYLNYNVMINPLDAMEMYTKDKKIKFICSNKKCIDNLPSEDTYIIEIKDNKKENIINYIKSLNSDFRYITVSDNQETDGNAILIGYWLTQQNKKYIGKLPLYQRFSLEYIKSKILKDNSLNNYRDNNKYINFLDNISNKINKELKNKKEINILFLFFMIGFFIRLLFIKYQNKISKNYYITNKNNNIIMSLIFIVISIFGIYYLIYDFIHYYQILIDINFNNNDNNLLQSILILLLSIQIILMLNINKKSIFIIMCLIGLKLLDLYNLHPLELTYLIGSESVVLIVQMYWYCKYKKNINLSKLGIYKININQNNNKYPEKWLNVIKFLNKENGILIDLTKEYQSYIDNYKFKNKLYIIRSCDINDNENKLAGYYHSKVAEIKNINSVIDEIKSLGCCYIWIQEYIECFYYGVYSTYNKDFNKDLILVGKNNNVTEGYASIELNEKNKEYKVIKNKMREIEKYYKSPVVVEFGYNNNKVYIFQIRIMNDFGKLLYPENINNYIVGDNFIPLCSSITGNFYQEITKNNYKYYTSRSVKVLIN